MSHVEEICGIKCNHDGEDDCFDDCCLSEIHGGSEHWCHRHFAERMKREQTSDVGRSLD